jgi:alkanesulfonate monooxygenase SsuD/methylene tetrahydromethanopterin reductase-like flavin-dependent oxidoreductase (luciferase family)
MSPVPRFGFSIPQGLAGGPASPAIVRQVAARAEALGLDSLWVQDEALDGEALAPLELLAHVAAMTTRVRLGVGVLLSGLRSPLDLARRLATLDRLSEGRLVAGLGLGARADVYAAHGVAPDRWVERFVEGLALVKDLWTGAPVSREHTFWTLRDVRLELRPVQQPHPPIWIGGHHPAALRRAARLGDGFLGGGLASTGDFARAVALVRTGLAEAGRDAREFALGKRVFIMVDDDPVRAEQRLDAALQVSYGAPGLARRVGAFGPPAACARALSALAAAGAGLVILNPPLDEPEQLERLGAEVLPLVV